MYTTHYSTATDFNYLPDGLIPGPDLTLSSLRNIDDCAKLIGTDGRVKFMNENVRLFMNLPDLDGVRGMFWWDLWPEDRRDMLEDALKSATAGKVVRFDGDRPTSIGTWKKWDVCVTPVFDDDDTVSNLLVISKQST